MIRKLLLFLPLVLFQFGHAQEGKKYKIPETVPFTIDSLYREDQFYLGFNFNLITDRPADVSQESFSGGASIGFIRDFPLNRERDFGLGLGIGWAINSYGQNLKISSEGGVDNFSVIDDGISYSTNRFTTQAIEVPVEVRWRTSTPLTYKFWRVYGGLKAGYVYHLKTNYKDDSERIVLRDVEEFNPLRLGAYLTFGYNTFNFQFYYSLNPFFDNAMVEGEQVDLRTLKLGLVFYIL